MRESENLTKINIRPEVNILSVLRHLNYKPWFAIAEFIDNALQSYHLNKARLEALDSKDFKLSVEVEIDVDGPGRIIIRDNAAGISEVDFQRAFRAAEVPPDTSGLSEFGMGMKSAACWFASQWSVRTKALDEEIERTIKFDMRHIVSNRIEFLSVDTCSAPKNAHYTELVLTNLHHSPKGGRTLGKIKEHLASIYRVFLRNHTLSLVFNGEQLQYEPPEILKAPSYREQGGLPIEWYKDINFDLGAGQRITGFAALRKTASTTHAGFSLFRRDRLIHGSADETYRPDKIFGNPNSYRYQRLFGELHLEGFDVSHTKDGFRWEEYEDEFLDLLRDELKKAPMDLPGQAEGHRVNPTKQSIADQAIAATNSVATSIENDVKAFLELEVEAPSKPDPLPDDLKPSVAQTSERITRRINDGEKIWEITLRTSIDPARGDWLSFAKKSEDSANADKNIRYLTLDISLAHPFATQFLGPQNENIELFIRIAVALAISLTLAQDATGTSPQFTLSHFNALLRNALSQAYKL